MPRVTLQAIIDASTHGLVKEIAKAKGEILGLTKAASATVAGGLLSSLTVQSLGLASQLAEASGAFLAIPAGAALTAQAVGTVKMAFSGVSEAIKSGGKDMGELTQEAQGFVREAVKIKEQFEEIKKVTQANMMPGMTDFLKSAAPLVPIISKGFGDMAKSIGDVAREAGKKLETPIFKADLANILSNNASSARNLGMGVVEMLEPLRDLVSVGSGVINYFSASAPLLARQVSQYAAAKRESGEMALAMIKGFNTLIDTGRILLNFGGIVQNVMSAARRVSGDTLGNLTSLMVRLNAATQEGTAGHQKLVAFFNALDDVGRGAADVVMGVAEGVLALARALGLGGVSFSSYARDVRELGAAFREFTGTTRVRNELASFANDVRGVFTFVLSVVQSAASGITSANEDMAASFRDVIFVLAAVSSPARAVVSVLLIAAAGSESFRDAVVDLAGSLGKLVGATAEAVGPFVDLAAVLISLGATAVAPVIDGVAASVGFLADNMNVVLPLIVAFGAVWAGIKLAAIISMLGGLSSALLVLTGRLLATQAVLGFAYALGVLRGVGLTLIPTLTALRATLLGFSVVSGSVAVLAAFIYALTQIATEGKRAEESVNAFMRQFDVRNISGVKEALAGVVDEINRLKETASVKEDFTVLNWLGITEGESAAAVRKLQEVRSALEGLHVVLAATGPVARSSGMSMDEFSRAVGANVDAVDGSADSVRRYSEELARGAVNVQFIAAEFRTTNAEAITLAESLGVNLQSGMREVVDRVSSLTPAFNAARVEMNLSSVEVANLASHFINLSGPAGEVDAQLRALSTAIGEISQHTGLSAEGIAGLAKALGIDLADGSRSAVETLTILELKLNNVPLASSLTTEALNAVGQAALEAKGNVDLFQLSLDTLAAQNDVQLALATTRQRILELGESTMLTADANGVYSLSVTQNEIALRGIISQILRTTEQTYQQKLATEGQTGATRIATATMQELTTALFASAAAKGVDIGQLQRMFGELGIVIDQTGRLSSEIRAVPPQSTTQFNTPGLDTAINRVAAFHRSIAGLPNAKNITLTVTEQRRLMSGSPSGRGALGGEVMRLPRYQSGGMVSGRGSPISDHVLAAVSPTEWIINSMVTAKQGHQKMDMLNAGMADIVPRGRRRDDGSLVVINGPLVNVTVHARDGDGKALAREISEEVDKRVTKIMERVVSRRRAGSTR